VANPPADKEHTHVTIGRAYWLGSKEAPSQSRDWRVPPATAGAGRLCLHGEEWFDDTGDYLQHQLFLG